MPVKVSAYIERTQFIKSKDRKFSMINGGWPESERVKTALNIVWRLRQDGQKARLLVEQDDSWTLDDSENPCAQETVERKPGRAGRTLQFCQPDSYSVWALPTKITSGLSPS